VLSEEFTRQARRHAVFGARGCVLALEAGTRVEAGV